MRRLALLKTRKPWCRNVSLHAGWQLDYNLCHLMRAFCFVLLIATAFPSTSRSDDLIPGVVTFDPLPFLYGEPGRSGDDIFTDRAEIRRYTGRDNDLRIGMRDIIISVRTIGFSIGNGKVVTYQKLDEKAFRSWMQAKMDSTRYATNITTVTDAKVGGQDALFASYQIAQPNWPKNPGALFPFEVYWVRIESNRVVEIKLSADTAEHLDTLKPCLSKFRITRKKG